MVESGSTGQAGRRQSGQNNRDSGIFAGCRNSQRPKRIRGARGVGDDPNAQMDCFLEHFDQFAEDLEGLPDCDKETFEADFNQICEDKELGKILSSNDADIVRGELSELRQDEVKSLMKKLSEYEAIKFE